MSKILVSNAREKLLFTSTDTVHCLWMRIFQLAPVLPSVSSQPLEKAEIITSLKEPRREETLQPAFLHPFRHL